MILVIDRHVFFNTVSAKHFSSDLTYVTLLLFLGPPMVCCKADLLRHFPRIFQSSRLHIHLTHSIVITKHSLWRQLSFIMVSTLTSMKSYSLLIQGSDGVWV